MVSLSNHEGGVSEVAFPAPVLRHAQDEGLIGAQTSREPSW
jgi:hypothetical protein